jgi:hypothetical protein
MARTLALFLLIVIWSGCNATPKQPNGVSADPLTKAEQPATKIDSKPPSSMFYNPRLKSNLYKFKQINIGGSEDNRIVQGIWLPESNDPGKGLVFPEQVSIWCTRSEMSCEVASIELEVQSELVSIPAIQQDEYHVDSWNSDGLSASYGPWEIGNLSDKCHRHVLVMNFKSGVVTLSDISTHAKGCEMFAESNTYRLGHGDYYVDTTPNADYTVALNHIEQGFARDNQIQVANKEGDLISKTKEGGSIKSRVKKACDDILTDWATKK